MKILTNRYIKTRCQFLDNLPQYNYNQGRVVGGGDTEKLGSILMNAMLREVPQFCDPSTKDDWSLQAHQQVNSFNKKLYLFIVLVNI